MTGWQILGGAILGTLIALIVVFFIVRPIVEHARKYGWAGPVKFFGCGAAFLIAYIVGLLLLMGKLP